VEFTSASKSELVERIKAILASKGLTLYQVSQKTRNMYGRSSLYFLPHNLYYDLRLGTFSPSLHQLFALSQISDYRVTDWLRVFGFDLEDMTRLQVLLPSKRTMVLDSSLEDPESWVPWFQNKRGNPSPSAIAPLGHFLDFMAPRRLRSLLSKRKNFIYAKVGREDAFAFPDLLAGSIVRVNKRLAKTMLPTGNGNAPKCMFLIEHANGFCCCRLQSVSKNRVMPLSTQLPFAQVEFRLHDEVRVLGVLDLEIRSLLKPEQPDVPEELARHWRPSSLVPEETKLSHLFRSARSRMGLSLREASAMSQRIASDLGHEQYFAASGSLSDYEALDTSPRHVHKAITLCAVYGLQLAVFLKSVGLDLEKTGEYPIPDGLVARKNPAGFPDGGNETDEATGNGFLQELLTRSQPVPFLLRGSLSDLSGLRSPSLHDFFWVGGELNPLHPALVNGLLVIVNRHRKKPIYSRSKPLWQQRLYMLVRRDGTYMCGCCSLENGVLIVHAYSDGCSQNYQRPERLRNHQDAEVVGEIVTIARSL
jgi:transcriptional regulator with XRE-family HTH domain